ncbi:MAG: HAMP domain-containing histidine kinase [Ruminococcaceae bacterium]|nr:HAMP domain-containing histidine kinase [Oscillospiraceae bacterium]
MRSGTQKNKNKKPIGIRWKLFVYMALLVLLMLTLLWVLQSLFLEPLYKQTRKREIETMAETLIALPVGETLADKAETLALKNGICVILLDGRGKTLLSVSGINNCAIHNINRSGLSTLSFLAEQNGGELMQSFRKDDYRDMYYVVDESRDESSLSGTESVIYTRVFSDSEANRYTLYLNTIITPVSSTVSTLNRMLLAVSGVTLIVSLLFAYTVSKSLSRPLVEMSEKAKKLAAGDYDIDFVSGGDKEIRQLGQTLNAAEADLKKAETFRRELIANVSHDLRTPLTMISGYAEVMRDIPGENTPENVQIIIDETERLTSLVNDVLDLSKLQSGTQKPELCLFNFTETVKTAMERYRRLTEQRGYDIRFEADSDLIVLADRTRILQVIYNLVNNALTYTGEDKKVLLRQLVRDGRLRFEVTDSGEGIEQDKLIHIWDRYYKVDSVHKRSAVGTGLGLSIVKTIVEMHGGSYGVISEMGKGSTFWFELPREALSDAPTAG